MALITKAVEIGLNEMSGQALILGVVVLDDNFYFRCKVAIFA